MPADIQIKNGKIATERGLIYGGLNISEGRITKISSDSRLEDADLIIDAEKKIVIPGLIDAHVHLRDMAQRDKETFNTGTAAAARGGVTSIIDMPNNAPPTISLSTFKNKLDLCRDGLTVNTGFYCGPPEEISEIRKIVEEGAFGFKVYLNKPISNINVLDVGVLRSIASEIATYGGLILFHAELVNPKNIVGEGWDLNSQVKAFIKAHDKSLELKAVKYILDAIKGSKIRAHFCHITTSKSIEMINKSNSNGLYSIEVSPHHLLLDEGVIYKIGAAAKTAPPLRDRCEVSELWDLAIINGKADIIASDHAPHTLTEKDAGFNEAPSGVPGLETTLPLMMTRVLEGEISLDKFLRLTAYRPAALMRVVGRGKIEKGYFADVAIVDCSVEYKIDSKKFLSKAKYSPFDGFKVKCKVDKTIVNGQLVYDADQGIVNYKSGVILKPNIQTKEWFKDG